MRLHNSFNLLGFVPQLKRIIQQLQELHTVAVFHHCHCGVPSDAASKKAHKTRMNGEMALHTHNTSYNRVLCE